MSGASISIALPDIGADLGISQSELQWLVSSYALTSGCFLLLFGRLADLFGRKKVFLAGTLWSLAWSLGSGFAPNSIALNVMRALHGMGSAATVPSAIGILAHEFPPSRSRSIAFATFSAGAPLGGAIGFVIGGVMTEYTSVAWRGVFYVSAGIAGLTMLAAALAIHKDKPSTEKDWRVDWFGATLSTIALVLLTFSLAQSSSVKDGWRTPYIPVVFVVSVLLLGCFVGWEYYLETRTTRPPLMRLGLWTRANGRFAVIQLIVFFDWACFTTWLFFVTLYYQEYKGISPVGTTVRVLPMTVSGLLCNLVVALVVGRISGTALIAFGCFFTALASLLFALIVPSASYWAFGFPAAAVVVFGADFMFATGSLFVAKIALPHEQSLAGGIFNTVNQIQGDFANFVLRTTSMFCCALAKKYTPGFRSQVTANKVQSGGDRENHQFVLSDASGGKDKFPKAQYFKQPLDHFDKSVNNTFGQRYWVNKEYYEPGGPVFVLDGGETSGEDRLPFLQKGILAILANETKGLGIVLEHRYYGESIPVGNFSTDSMRWLTNAQALQDSANFIANVKIDGLDHNVTAPGTKWIYYGGSYAGARAAHMRVLYPHLVYGAIASSAVTHATIDYWEYADAVRRTADPVCISHLTTAIQAIDDLLSTRVLAKGLKSWFGLGELESDQDFVSVLMSPVGYVQGQNWDSAVGSDEWSRFCAALGSGGADSTLGWGAPPNKAHPTIVSRRLTLDYTSAICRQAFPPGEHISVPEWPNVTVVNALGDYGLAADRLAFIDGDEDPWLPATPHSPHAPERADTILRPFKLIRTGVHHHDENGVEPHSEEPAHIQAIHIQEIEFVKAWLKGTTD
ncbi:putative MFS-type transporter C1683,03c [Rhizoctonia solani AG-1 IB]|uniref:Putative MFS-type transporter C1683,03c n=1 Tax=Thanatephorus cucumeris (strain AG1-IB / isolate 7/3/14) TaxID=1108050 RepID=M5BP78_THACB|nr:putative MFS-type transporter C1683,03c [Rhizoctonia solani AG-1 IB]